MDVDRVGHMVTAARNILGVAAGGRRVLSNAVKQAAVIRWFEVMGEASKGVSPAARALAPQLPWTGLVGMRNVLIHGYDQVDLERVWEAIVRTRKLVKELEALRARLDRKA